MARKKIECYIDCVSPYSYYAFHFLKYKRVELKKHGVDVEFIPVFLGGINVGTGNKPPGELPAKAKYSRYDSKRAQEYFGLSFETPDFFPILSLRPQRCLIYTKQHYSRDAYESLFEQCFKTMWVDHLDLSKPENMRIAVSRAFSNETDIEAILAAANDPVIKQTLNRNTEHAINHCGAFGCPWSWVINAEGKGEPFFGSDRWGYMWKYLGLPHRDLELLEPISPESKPRL